jgi:acetyl-CoA synthetase
LGVEWFQKYTRLYDDSRGMPWTTWFLGGKLNITHNCLDRHIRDGRGAAPALWFESDNGNKRSLSYDQLYNSVNSLASAMTRMGIQKGDRVAMCMPISPEAVTVMFAAFKIGAVCMQLPARIAPQEIVPHLGQAQAQVLFLNDAYPRGGKLTSAEGIYEAVVALSPSVRHIVVHERVGNGLAQRQKCMAWDGCLHLPAREGITGTEFLDSEHPSLILYSSAPRAGQKRWSTPMAGRWRRWPRKSDLPLTVAPTTFSIGSQTSAG